MSDLTDEERCQMTRAPAWLIFTATLVAELIVFVAIGVEFGAAPFLAIYALGIIAVAGAGWWMHTR